VIDGTTLAQFLSPLVVAPDVLGGELGALLGAIIGNQFGVGAIASYVPSTHTWFAGPTVTFNLSVNGSGFGVGGNLVNVPPGQSPNAIAGRPSF
jgi:hypothetical protein